jgi:hypothetical protein
METNFYPTKLLRDFIENSNYEHKDDLYIIIDLIVRKQSKFKSTVSKRYGRVQISRENINSLLPSYARSKKALDFLIDNGLIERHDSYSNHTSGKTFTKAYRIMENYLGKTVKVPAKDTSIIKKLTKKRYEIRKIRIKNIELAKSRYYKAFKINVIPAMEAILNKTINEIYELAKKYNITFTEQEIIAIIECNNDFNVNKVKLSVLDTKNELVGILQRMVIHQTQVQSINDGWLYFKRNKTNFRLDTNLTTLPSYLRQFIVSDEVLWHIDIKNSQPFFLYCHLQYDKLFNSYDELERYGRIVANGELYEKFGEFWTKETGEVKTRQQIKEMIFKIFYSKFHSYKKYKDVFEKMFPNIMAHIYYLSSVANNALAIQLQTMESHIVLDEIMFKLGEKGITPFTIHDSFICADDELEEVLATIKENFTTKYKIVPELHVNKLVEVETDEDSDFDFEEFIEMYNNELSNEVI